MADGPGWGNWFVAAVVLPAAAVVATLYVSQQDLRLREKALKTGEETLAVAQQKQKTDAAQAATGYESAFGAGSKQIASIKALFADPNQDQEDRADALRAFALGLQEITPVSRPLVNVRDPLPAGAHSMANELRRLLIEQPTRVDVSSTDLHRQYWQSGNFSEVLFIASDLRAVDFTGSSFAGATMEQASLRCADLSEVDAGDLVLKGADLHRVDFRSSDLRSVQGLKQEQLEVITYDAATKWPRSVRPDLLQASQPYGSTASCSFQDSQEGRPVVKPTVPAKTTR